MWSLTKRAAFPESERRFKKGEGAALDFVLLLSASMPAAWRRSDESGEIFLSPSAGTRAEDYSRGEPAGSLPTVERGSGNAKHAGGVSRTDNAGKGETRGCLVCCHGADCTTPPPGAES